MSPELAVVQFAAEHKWIETLGLIMEACGGFSMPNGNDAELLDYASNGYAESKPVTCISDLRAYIESASGISGVKVARRAVAHALDGARSPTEAILSCVLHLPFSFGGFACTPMLLNHRIDFDDAAVAVAGMPYAICDAYLPGARDDLEYNGAYHVLQEARKHDERRNAGLSCMGIRVLALNNDHLRSIPALEAIAMSIHARSGNRYRNRTANQWRKTSQLLNGLRVFYGLRPC